MLLRAEVLSMKWISPARAIEPSLFVLLGAPSEGSHGPGKKTTARRYVADSRSQPNPSGERVTHRCPFPTKVAVAMEVEGESSDGDS